MENVDISFRSPADTGFDMERFNKVIATFAGGGGWAVTVDKDDDSITAPAIMCHVFYNAPGGLLHRTRFWMGYRFTEEGKPELCLPPRCVGTGRVCSGFSPPQCEGVHALRRLPASDLQRIGP